MNFNKGDRVIVFDHRKYVNDKVTPSNITFLPATIIKQYNYKGDEVVDVIFDHDGRTSYSHFVWGIEKIA